MILPSETHSPSCRPDGRIDEIKRDGVYFWDMVTFSVEGYLFRLPRYQFIVGSQYFAATYLSAPSNPLLASGDLASNDGRSDYSDEYEAVEAPGGSTSTTSYPSIMREPQFERVIALECVTAAQFRTFLTLLFPIHSTSTTITLSKPEWLSILTLSTLWHFNHFRALAIHHLNQRITDPIELILVGRSNLVTEWVLRGYEALVWKDEAIEENESEMIADKTSVKLYIIRHGLARRLKELEITPRVNVRTELDERATHAAFVRDQLAVKFRTELEELRREEDRRRIVSEQSEGGAMGGKDLADGQSTGETGTKSHEETRTAKVRPEEEIHTPFKPTGMLELGVESGGIGNKRNFSNETKEMDERMNGTDSRVDTTDSESRLDEVKAIRETQEKDGRPNEDNAGAIQPGAVLGAASKSDRKLDENEQAMHTGGENMLSEEKGASAEELEAKAREEHQRALAKIALQEKKRLQQEVGEAGKKQELEVLKKQQKLEALKKRREVAAGKRPGRR